LSPEIVTICGAVDDNLKIIEILEKLNVRTITVIDEAVAKNTAQYREDTLLHLEINRNPKYLSDSVAKAAKVLKENPNREFVLGPIETYSTSHTQIIRGEHDPVLKLAALHDNVSISFEEHTTIHYVYGSGILDRWDLTARERLAPDLWSRTFDTSFPKSLFRYQWWIERARTLGFDFERVIVYPSLQRLNDHSVGSNHIYDALERRFNERGAKIEGLKTLGNVWKYYYPEMTTEQALATQLNWLIDVYPKSAHYVSAIIFDDSSNNMMEFENLPELLTDNTLSANDVEVSETENIQPQYKSPEYHEVVVKSLADKTNVRQTPALESPVIEQFSETTALMEMETARIDEQEWYSVILPVNGEYVNHGWVLGGTFMYYPITRESSDEISENTVNIRIQYKTESGIAHKIIENINALLDLLLKTDPSAKIDID
jgi:hypothetical protein